MKAPSRPAPFAQEAGAHRLILFPEKLGVNEYERELETMAKARVV